MKRMKRVVAMVLIVAMMLGSMPSYAVSFYGANAKSEYLRMEKKFWAELKSSWEKSEVGKLYDFTDSIDGNYQSQMDIEVEIPNMRNRKYVLTENGTYLERYADGKIEAYVEGEKVATLNMVANDNKISIQIPELYEKYITVDMGDLGGLLKKFEEDVDVSELPAGLYYSSDVKKVLALSSQEKRIINNAVKKFSKLFDKEFLKNESFSKESKEIVSVDGTQYNCDVVSYRISETQMIDAISVIWDEFKKETQLVDVLYKKLEEIYKLSLMTSPSDEELFTKEQILGAVDTVIRNIKRELQETAGLWEPLYLKSTLYCKDGKIIKRTFGIEGDDSDIILYSVKNNNQSYYAVIMDGSSKIEDRVQKNGGETVHKITFSEGGYSAYLEDELLVKICKINNDKYNIEFSADGSDEIFNIEYTKNKASLKEYDISMDFSVSNGYDSFGLNTRLSYKKDNALKKINTKTNEINLNSKSKEELEKLFNENKYKIIERAQGKFLSAFYYEEIMETTQRIVDRMKLRTDKSSAALACRAVRVWLTDYTYDPILSSKLNYYNNISGNHWTKLEDLHEIEYYANTQITTSDELYYYVCLDSNAKVIVGASKSGTDLPHPSSITGISVQTTGSRILYIEP